MDKSSILLNADLVKKSEKVFSKKYDISLEDAIEYFLGYVIRTKCIPFEIEVPNKKTLKAFKEAEDIMSGKKKSKTYTLDELRKELDV